MNESPAAQITIRDMSLWVNLGIRDIEKTERQEIRLTVEIYFPQKPAACDTDRLEDTVCYHELVRKIVEMTESRTYGMIEKLAQDVVTLVKSNISAELRVKVQLHKVHPPIARLQGGIYFTLLDT